MRRKRQVLDSPGGPGTHDLRMSTMMNGRICLSWRDPGFALLRLAQRPIFSFAMNPTGSSSDQTDAYGFQNFMIVSTYTILDFDRDGDLDFVTNSINGPLWLLRNNNSVPATVFRSR